MWSSSAVSVVHSEMLQSRYEEEQVVILVSVCLSIWSCSDLFTQKTGDYWIFFLTLETLEMAVWENPHTSLFGTNNHGTLKY